MLGLGLITRPFIAAKNAVVNIVKAVWRGIKFVAAGTYNLFFGPSREDIEHLNRLLAPKSKYSKQNFIGIISNARYSELEFAEKLKKFDQAVEACDISGLLSMNIHENSRLVRIAGYQKVGYSAEQIDQQIKEYDQAEAERRLADENVSVFSLLISYFFGSKAEETTKVTIKAPVKVEKTEATEATERPPGILSSFIEPISAPANRIVHSESSSSISSAENDPNCDNSRVEQASDVTTTVVLANGHKRVVPAPFSWNERELVSLQPNSYQKPHNSEAPCTEPEASKRKIPSPFGAEAKKATGASKTITISVPARLNQLEEATRRREKEQADRQLELEQQRELQQRLAERELELQQRQAARKLELDQKYAARQRELEQKQAPGAKESANPILTAFQAIDSAGKSIDKFMADEEKQRQLRESAKETMDEASRIASEQLAAAKVAAGAAWSALTGSNTRQEDQLFTWQGPKFW